MAPIVLLIGGTDSSGGAGIARDVCVLTECGVEASVAITAVTAQTHREVRAIHHMPADLVAAQIESAFESQRIAAVKIGMLGTRATVEAVATRLRERGDIPIVLDPVHIASSGHVLLDAPGLCALREDLLPLATLVTPNTHEAASLLGISPALHAAEAAEHARSLRALGCANVLVKGGHMHAIDTVDVLIDARNREQRFQAPRLPAEMRGTGCALASAITARLAQADPLTHACRFAKQYLFRKLAAALQDRAVPGSG